MPSFLRQVSPAPYLGIDEGPPDLIPPTKASEVINWLTGIPGKLCMRGPTFTLGAALGSTTFRGRPHHWTFNNVVLTAFAKLRSAETLPTTTKNERFPLRPPGGEGDLVGYQSSIVSGALTPVAYADQNNVPGPRYTRLGGFVYGFAQSGTAVVTTVGGAIVPVRRMITWDGSAAVSTRTTAVSPSSGVDICSYLNRLFVLGGAPAASTTIEPNSLFWSDPGGAPAGAVTEWQDDVSGLINRIVVGDDDQNDIAVGLASLPNALVIFKERSIWTMTGQTPTTWTLKRVVAGVGCQDANSIVEVNDRIYFLGQDGFYTFDGVGVARISDPVSVLGTTNQMQRDLRWGATTVDNYVRGELIGDDRIMWVYGIPSVSGVGVTKTFVYHIPSQSWAYFTMMTAPSGLAYLEDGAVWAWPTRVADSVVSWSRYLLDYNDVSHLWQNGNQQLFDLSQLSRRYPTNPYYDYTTTSGASIPASVQSRLQSLAGPGDQAQLHRFVFDYYAGSPTSEPGQLIPGLYTGFNGTIIRGMPTTEFGTEVLQNTGPQRFREAFDAYEEVREPVLRIGIQPSSIKFASGGRVYSTTEIYGWMIEAQVTRQRSNP